MRSRWEDERESRSVVIDIADEMDTLEVGPRVAAALAAQAGQTRLINILRVVGGLGMAWADPDWTDHSIVSPRP